MPTTKYRTSRVNVLDGMTAWNAAGYPTTSA
jgi:hypothetical protein